MAKFKDRNERLNALAEPFNNHKARFMPKIGEPSWFRHKKGLTMQEKKLIVSEEHYKELYDQVIKLHNKYFK
jgi:hypothetical protein